VDEAQRVCPQHLPRRITEGCRQACGTAHHVGDIAEGADGGVGLRTQQGGLLRRHGPLPGRVLQEQSADEDTVKVKEPSARFTESRLLP